jgi:hypothetical protein
VGDDSITSGHLFTLPPEDVHHERAMHLRKNFIDQLQPVLAIGPPGEIREESETELVPWLRGMRCRRFRKERWQMKGSQPRTLVQRHKPFPALKEK